MTRAPLAAAPDVSGVADLWHRVTTAQPAPDRTTVLVVGAAVLVALLVPGVWHLLRHGLTIVHEAALAAGGAWLLAAWPGA